MIARRWWPSTAAPSTATAVPSGPRWPITVSMRRTACSLAPPSARHWPALPHIRPPPRRRGTARLSRTSGRHQAAQQTVEPAEVAVPVAAPPDHQAVVRAHRVGVERERLLDPVGDVARAGLDDHPTEPVVDPGGVCRDVADDRYRADRHRLEERDRGAVRGRDADGQ